MTEEQSKNLTKFFCSQCKAQENAPYVGYA